MVTKREKVRNRYLESKRDIFMHQVAILRSQSGRKLNARDYQSVVTAHRQSTSIYDNPEAVVRTAEALASVADDNSEIDGTEPTSRASDHQKPKLGARPHVKGPRPTQSGSTAAVVTKRKRAPSPSENPYRKPTYRTFEWLLPSRRRSSAGTADESSSVKRKRRRRKLFDASPPTLGEIVDPDRTDGSSAVGMDGHCVDVTGSDVAVDRELVQNGSPLPSDWHSGGDNFEADLSGNVSPPRDKTTGAGGDCLSPFENRVHEPCSTTPLRHSPLNPSDEPAASDAGVPFSPQSGSPATVSKLQSRHFSDALLDGASAMPRPWTVSQNSEDVYVDVVSDLAVQPSSPPPQPPRAVQNLFAKGLSRLSKVKPKKHLDAGGLVNGLRQRTLDSFIRRVPNDGRRPNGTLENTANVDCENRDLKQNSLPAVKMKRSELDRVTDASESFDRNALDDRTADAADNFVDMDSIECVWRRRTSLRSSTAFMTLLGPDLAQLT